MSSTSIRYRFSLSLSASSASFFFFDETLALQQPFDDPGQRIQVTDPGVLDHVVADAHFHGFDGDHLIALPRDYEDGRQWSPGGQPLDHFDAAVARHDMVHGNNVVLPGIIHFQTDLAVRGDIHDIADPLQSFLYETRQSDVVFHEEDANGSGCIHAIQFLSGASAVYCFFPLKSTLGEPAECSRR